MIADSEPLHFQAFHEILAEEGIPFAERDYYAGYLGFSDVGVFEAVRQEHGISWNADRVSRLVVHKAARLEALARNRSVLFPGAEALIRRAGEAVPLAIASGALRAEILRVLDRAGLTRWFPVIVAAGETPESKPAADPYRRAVTLLAEFIGRPLDPAAAAATTPPWGTIARFHAGAIAAT